jgi:hypothetical protein
VLAIFTKIAMSDSRDGDVEFKGDNSKRGKTHFRLNRKVAHTKYPQK